MNRPKFCDEAARLLVERPQLLSADSIADAWNESEERRYALLGKFLIDMVQSHAVIDTPEDASRSEMADAYIRAWQEQQATITRLRNLCGRAETAIESLGAYCYKALRSDLKAAREGA